MENKEYEADRFFKPTFPNKFFTNLGFKVENFTENQWGIKYQYFTLGYITIEMRTFTTHKDNVFKITICPCADDRVHTLYLGKIKTKKQFHLIMDLLNIKHYGKR